MAMTLYDVFSPTDARENLNDANSMNFTMLLWLNEEPSQYIPNPELLASILKADWSVASVFLDVQLVNEEALKLMEQDDQREGSILTMINGASGMTENYLRRFTCESIDNTSFWCNPYFDRLMEAADNEIDPDIRKEYLERAQAIIFEEAPVIPIFGFYNYVLYSRSLSDFNLTHQGYYNLQEDPQQWILLLQRHQVLADY